MTAKRIFSFIVLVTMSVACIACYSSKDLKTDRSFAKRVVKVGYFCKIESYTSADIKFVQGKTSSVRIEGTKSLVDNLDIKQNGETLVITTKGRGIRITGPKRLTVYVSSPDITSVYLKGSGDLKLKAISTPMFLTWSSQVRAMSTCAKYCAIIFRCVCVAVAMLKPLALTVLQPISNCLAVATLR